MILTFNNYILLLYKKNLSRKFIIYSIIFLFINLLTILGFFKNVLAFIFLINKKFINQKFLIINLHKIKILR